MKIETSDDLVAFVEERLQPITKAIRDFAKGQPGSVNAPLERLDIPVVTNNQTVFTVADDEARTSLFLNGELLPKTAFTLAPPRLVYHYTVPLDTQDVLTLS